MSPALVVQALVLIIGGLAVYWSTISEIRAALVEEKVKNSHHEKTIDALQERMLDLDRRLQDHDEVTRKALPLGKKSEIAPFTLERSMN